MNDYREFSELYHHGVKGMHWGIRRYQNYDGSLKAAGRSRYGIKERRTAVKEQQRKNTINKYKNAGMSDAEAQEAYEKKQKAMKIAGIALGAAVVGAGAYYLYRTQGHKFLDYNIPKGAKIQTLTSDAGVDRIKNGERFYFDRGNRDRDMYRGHWGSQDTLDFGKIFKNEVQLKNRNNIKVASELSAKNAFVEQAKKDSRFNQELKSYVKENRSSPFMKVQDVFLPPNFQRASAAADKYLEKGGNINALNKKEQKELYRYFNYALTNHDSTSGESARKMYFSNLRKRGYGAITDSNDAINGGFNTKTAAIMMPGNKNLSTVSVKKLTQQDVDKAQINAALRILGDTGIYATPLVGAAAYNNYEKNYDRNVIKKRNTNKK